MSNNYTKDNFSDSDSSTGSTVGRIHEILNAIKTNNRLERINTREDIAKMADHCTNLLVNMKANQNGPNVVKKDTNDSPGSLGGDGDHRDESKWIRKDSLKTLSPGSFDGNVANQMGGQSLQEYMKRKKERPKFGESFNAKLAEKMKEKLQLSSQEMEDLPGKRTVGKVGCWKGTKNIMKSHTSISSGSELSSDDSWNVAINKKIYQQALKKGNTKGQIGGEDEKSEEIDNKLTTDLKKGRENTKVQKWLRTQKHTGSNVSYTANENEEFPLENNFKDFFPTKEHLKKNHELIKSRMDEIPKLKTPVPHKTSVGSRTPSIKLTSSSSGKKNEIRRVNDAAFSLPSMRKNHKSNYTK